MTAPAELAALAVPSEAPPGLRHVGRYVRLLPVSLERMFENALDWEHLPHLHASSFTSIEKLADGNDWWSARVGLAPAGAEAEIELRLEPRERRWITTTTGGAGVGGQIWTVAVPVSDGRSLHVVVDFHLPGLADASESQADSVGRLYRDLYARLYDEDESMMVGRQAALDARSVARTGTAGTDAGIALGAVDALRSRLPLELEFAGARIRVIEHAGTLHAHPVECPHWLGPLRDAPDASGALRCPWHGYRFDLESGAELAGRRCRLPQRAHVVLDGRGGVRLEPGPPPSRRAQ